MQNKSKFCNCNLLCEALLPIMNAQLLASKYPATAISLREALLRITNAQLSVSKYSATAISLHEALLPITDAQLLVYRQIQSRCRDLIKLPRLRDNSMTTYSPSACENEKRLPHKKHPTDMTHTHIQQQYFTKTGEKERWMLENLFD